MAGEPKISAEREREIASLVLEYATARREAAILRHETVRELSPEARAKRQAAEEKARSLESLQRQLSPHEKKFAKRVLDQLPSDQIDPLASGSRGPIP